MNLGQYIYEWVIEAHKNLQLAHQDSSESEKYFLAARAHFETVQPKVDVSQGYLREACIYLRIAESYMQSSISCIQHLSILHTPHYIEPDPAEKMYWSLQIPEIRVLLTHSWASSIYEDCSMVFNTNPLQERRVQDREIEDRGKNLSRSRTKWMQTRKEDLRDLISF